MNRRQFLTTLVGLVAVPSIVGRAMSAPKAEPIPKRKLKAVWTVECEQDLLSMHGISPDEPIVMGFRGKSFMETGIVYAPYLPIVRD